METDRGEALRKVMPAGRILSSSLLWTFAYVFAIAVADTGTGVASAQNVPTTSPLAAPAREWAVDCAKNEETVLLHPGSYLRYRLHQVDEKGDRMRDQIETPDGNVARLTERDGRPLTAEEDSAERTRLNDLIASPEAFAHHTRHEQSDSKMEVDLLRLMPEAMLWSYAEGQPQLPSPPGGAAALVVLDFKPNPKWSAPTLESEMLTGIEGRVWIDPQTRRMVHLQADVFRAINIGWGFVAHVYPGGTVTALQANAGGQRWILNHIDEKVTLRALLVKNVKQRMVLDTADFQPVPTMSYQKAIKMLLETPVSTH